MVAMIKPSLASPSSRKKPCLMGVVLFILLSSSLTCSAQASVTWSQIYGAHTVKVLIGTSDGGYAIAGSFGYSIEGHYSGSGSLLRDDFLLIKIDPNGTLQWTRRYGGERGDAEAYSLIQTSDRGYALVGKLSDNVRSYESDVWLVKTDSSGNMEWNHTYTALGATQADIIQTGDGGYAIAGGSCTTTDPKLTEFCLVKTDDIGNVQWNQTYGTPENYEMAYSLVEASDGGYTLAGRKYNLTESSIWLVKIDPLGNIKWNRTLSGDLGSQGLIAASDGGYALASNELIKTNAQGEVEWRQNYAGPAESSLSALVQVADGGYTLVGSTDSFDPTTNNDVWMVKTDPRGNMLWNKTFGGLLSHGQFPSSDSGHGVVQAPDGGYVILADTEFPLPSSSFGETRVWLIKTDEAGNAPKLSDVYPPVTDFPPIPPPTQTASEQQWSLQLPAEIILAGIVAGIGGAAGVLSFTVLPNKRKGD